MEQKPGLFTRWTWITEAEFRTTFGYPPEDKTYPSYKVLSAIRYGCERVDVECGGIITQTIGDKEFPYGLTKLQANVALEAAAWCANQFLTRGGNWDRGSGSINRGQTSASQSNPDEPDYFPPFLRDKLDS